ncbi:hypothetical protein Tco_0728921, partial [Tanacetum coccineum]
ECDHDGLVNPNNDLCTRDIGGNNLNKNYSNKVTDEVPLGSDPFGLDPLIKQKCDKVHVENCSVTLDFPSGFLSNSSGINKGSVSCNKPVDDTLKQYSGFSMLKRLEETIKIGTTLGLNMEGCEKTLDFYSSR